MQCINYGSFIRLATPNTLHRHLMDIDIDIINCSLVILSYPCNNNKNKVYNNSDDGHGFHFIDCYRRVVLLRANTLGDWFSFNFSTKSIGIESVYVEIAVFASLFSIKIVLFIYTCKWNRYLWCYCTSTFTGPSPVLGSSMVVSLGSCLQLEIILPMCVPYWLK